MIRTLLCARKSLPGLKVQMYVIKRLVYLSHVSVYLHGKHISWMPAQTSPHTSWPCLGQFFYNSVVRQGMWDHFNTGGIASDVTATCSHKALSSVRLLLHVVKKRYHLWDECYVFTKNHSHQSDYCHIFPSNIPIWENTDMFSEENILICEITDTFPQGGKLIKAVSPHWTVRSMSWYLMISAGTAQMSTFWDECSERFASDKMGAWDKQ